MTMKTKKPAFLIFMAVIILFVAPIPILKLSALLHRRGALPPGRFREISQAFPTPGSDLEFIQVNSGIRIPPSASEIHACIGGFNEPDSKVKFNLPPPDFVMFIKSTYCDQPFRPIFPWELQPDEHDPEWWRPGEAVNLEECEGGNSYIQQKIMVDRSDRKSLVIYVLTLMGDFEEPAE
jgi:hypothetical protein